MAPGPTTLSLAGAAIYFGVSALCLSAWRASIGGEVKPAARQPGWLAIAAFFALLVLSRLLVVEDRFDNLLRDIARNSGAYEGRMQWQAPLSVLAMVAIIAIASVIARDWLRSRGDPGRRALVIGRLGVAAMLGLITLRLISFHPVDSILYGGLRLNWWIDIGVSLLVGASAWTASRLPRT